MVFDDVVADTSRSRTMTAPPQAACRWHHASRAGRAHPAGRRITEFDPAATLTYAIEGLPARLHTVVNRWTLRDLMPVVDGAPTDDARAIYLMTRDNVLEGDTGASGAARQLGLTVNPPVPLHIKVPAHVASKFEGLVVRVADDDASPARGICGSW